MCDGRRTCIISVRVCDGRGTFIISVRVTTGGRAASGRGQMEISVAASLTE